LQYFLLEKNAHAKYEEIDAQIKIF